MYHLLCFARCTFDSQKKKQRATQGASGDLIFDYSKQHVGEELAPDSNVFRALHREQAPLLQIIENTHLLKHHSSRNQLPRKFYPNPKETDFRTVKGNSRTPVTNTHDTRVNSFPGLSFSQITRPFQYIDSPRTDMSRWY